MFKALYQKIAKKNRGFTLIELIVVIAILGILIAILVPSMIGFINSAKETAVKAEAKTISTAIAGYITNETAVRGTPLNTVVVTNMGFAAANGGNADLTKLNTALQGAGLLGKPISGTITGVAINPQGIVTELLYTRDGLTYTMSTDKVLAASK